MLRQLRRNSAAAGGHVSRDLSDRNPRAEVRQQTPAVGQRVTRPDGRLHGLGQTRYIDDLAFPGMLLRENQTRGHRLGADQKHRYARGRSDARRDGGIDRPRNSGNSFGPSLQDQPVLADERVYHAGDGVAAVAAVTEQIALEALDKIKVEYEPLPAVFDPLEALKDDAPKVHAPNSNIYATQGDQKGDVDKGFAASDHIFEGTLHHPDGRARIDRTSRRHRRLGRERPAHHLVDARTDHARRAPISRARCGCRSIACA